jgi:tRNA pseudouridine38-40 synthase
MWEENICPPILAPTVWPCPWPLDLAALNQAAAHVLGTHDFTSFAAADPDLSSREFSPFGGSRGLQPPENSQWIQGALAPGFLAQPTTSNQQPTTSIRTITHSEWRAAGDLLIYRVTADGFLHHMVRNLVGTFVQAGAHRLSPDSIPTLLAARDRASAGPTAPASGLFLVSVDYPAPLALSS